MSSDNGYVIRKNEAGKFVLQMYFASDDNYPDIDDGYGTEHDTLEDAVIQYNEIAQHAEWPIEYGLTTHISTITPNRKGRDNTMLQIETWDRKPFSVQVIQVTEENMEEVAKWCQGEIRTEDDVTTGPDSKKYIHVRVHRAANDRQTRAYVGDRVLYAGTSYKVYTDRAFLKSFERSETVEPAEATS